MRNLICLFLFSLIFFGCAAAPEPEPAPKPNPYAYKQECRNCGATWVTMTKEGPVPPFVDSCHECELLDMCESTGYLIMSIGSLSELVRHNPGNVEYAEKLARQEAELEAHLKVCDKCRKTLEAFGE